MIIGYGEIVRDKLHEADPLRCKGRVFEEYVRRKAIPAALTSQLLMFSRQQVLEPKILNLNSIVADMAKCYTRLVGEHIELVTCLARTWFASKQGPLAHRAEQVIMNLAVNARDAMPQGPES